MVDFHASLGLEPAEGWGGLLADGVPAMRLPDLHTGVEVPVQSCGGRSAAFALWWLVVSVWILTAVWPYTGSLQHMVAEKIRFP